MNTNEKAGKAKVFYHYVRLSHFGEPVRPGSGAKTTGGATAAIDRKNKVIGISVCSQQDLFNKRKGRTEAEVHLLKALYGSKNEGLRVWYPPVLSDPELKAATAKCISESVELLLRYPEDL